MGSQVRSIRLNSAHRSDMLKAVMAEWERQNPRPSISSRKEFLRIVVAEFKKHAAGKRTARVLDLLRFEDLAHVQKEYRINVQIVNGNEVLDTQQVCIPLSIADEYGMPRMPTCDWTHVDLELPEDELLESDIYNRLDDGKPYRLNVAAYCHGSGTATVMIERDTPEMVALNEGRRALAAWSKQRSQLESETEDLLSQFNSTKQIRESWPEMVPYLPPHIADPDAAVKLPVLATSRLSERLGIKDE